jgi:hypothetical protein
MLWLGAGCAGGRLVEGIYRDSAHRYQIRIPTAPWQAASLDGATMAFRAADLQAAMAFSMDCKDAEPGGIPWVARHLFFGLEAKRIQHREAIRLHDTEGVRTRLVARLDDVPVEVEGVTVRRGDCLYDFMYVAPPTTFAQGQADFQAFVESWSPLVGE